MKIAYTISGLYNSGGMENILLQKASYLAEKLNYDVTIVTTDNDGRKPFFPYSSKIKIIDLDINYDKAPKTNKIKEQVSYFFKKRQHFNKLKNLLFREKFDIVISLMDFDFGFLYKIKDGSKKIIEAHFSKNYKVVATTNTFLKCLQKFRTEFRTKIVNKYDKFIVLTKEDKQQWKNLQNIEVIPNFISKEINVSEGNKSPVAISIGRFNYQKGFDLLINAWRKVNQIYPEWKLKIIGGGDKSIYQNLIDSYGLQSNIELHEPVTNVSDLYSEASLYILSSRYEGLPLVLLEAMASGLPIVSFACPCGPTDIIKPSFGSLVTCFDTDALSDAIIEWIENKEKRKLASIEAPLEANNYSKNRIMEMWDILFKSLMN